MKHFLWKRIIFQGRLYRENAHSSLGLYFPFPTACLLSPASMSQSIKGATVFTSEQKLKTSAHSPEFRLSSYSASINSPEQELDFENCMALSTSQTSDGSLLIRIFENRTPYSGA